jgi:hypothetical protein
MSKRNDEKFTQFLKAMGGCLQGVAPGVLKAAADLSEDAFVATAAAFLCAFDPHQPGNPVAFRTCLDALAQSQSPAAIAVLTHVAQNAVIGRIKVEAVQRLAAVNLPEDARGLLRVLAKDGYKAPHQFPGDTVSSEDFRLAAVEALGKAPRSSKNDVQTVCDILAKEAEGRQPTPLFLAAVDAAYAMAKAFPVPTLLEIARKCPVGLMRLRIMAACSSQSAKAMKKHAGAIAQLLSDALSEFRDDQVLRDRLTELVKKAVTPELVRLISERFENDSLGNGRGAICLAALKAYNKTDDVLTNAYLVFARAQGNVHTGSPCIVGLASCATGGRAGAIVTRLVQQGSQGYNHLLTCGLLLEVLGTVPRVVNSICDALDAIPDPRRRSQSVESCCDAIVAVSLLSTLGGDKKDDWSWIKRQPQWSSHCQPDRMVEMVAALQHCPADCNGIVLLAGRMTTAAPLPGTTEMAKWFAERQDDLGQYFVEIALSETCKVSFSPSDGVPKECPLSQIEDLIVGRHQPKVREALPRIVYADGKLNRFALDLMRRRRIEFQQAARQVLQHHLTADDALFVLESLALETDDYSVLTIFQATEFYSPDKRVTAAVREKAIALGCRAVEKRTTAANPTLVVAILEKLLGRFEDWPTVRLSAYAACGRLADAGSIVPLKNRLKSDNDGKCAQAIRDALKRIGERLKIARPADSDAVSLVTWLNHVGELGDKMFLPHVLPLLSPPHSNPEVREKALWCLEHIGDVSAIPQIDEFMAETQPSGKILQAARHAKMTLLGRDDLEFVEALSSFAPADSPALDPSIDYAKAFGADRIERLARGLQNTLRQWNDGHWDDYVTKLDGVCDVLSRHLFENKWNLMALDEEKAKKLAVQQYGNRVDHSGFKQAFPRLHASMMSIHQFRHDAETAHLENTDGTAKRGLRKAEAELAKDEFRMLFEEYAGLIAKDQGISDG